MCVDDENTRVLCFSWGGQTDVDWNSQRTITNAGERLFVDVDGEVWAEDSLRFEDGDHVEWFKSSEKGPSLTCRVITDSDGCFDCEVANGQPPKFDDLPDDQEVLTTRTLSVYEEQGSDFVPFNDVADMIRDALIAYRDRRDYEMIQAAHYLLDMQNGELSDKDWRSINGIIREYLEDDDEVDDDDEE